MGTFLHPNNRPPIGKYARNTPCTRQTGSNNNNKHTKEQQRTKVLLGAIQYLSKCIKNNQHRYFERTIEDAIRMEHDRQTHERFQQVKGIYHQYPLFSTL